MRYRLLGRSGLRVSELCLGAMTFGQEVGWGASKQECAQMLGRFAEAGGNFIDTADKYTQGTSERFVGELVSRERDRWVIATKYTLARDPSDPNGAGNHRKSLVHALDASLERLNTDYVDILWLHLWDYVTPVDEVVRALDDQVRAGKVLYVGVSNTPAWVIAHANTLADLRGWSPFVAMQVQYSLVERTAEREMLPLAQAFDLAVTAWSPLGSGVLSGKYSASDHRSADAAGRLNSDPGWTERYLTDRNLTISAAVSGVAHELGASSSAVALAWLLARPGVVIPIIGARTEQQLRENLAAAELELTGDQLARLDAVSDIELGYPHNFASWAVQSPYTFGVGYGQLDDHRRARSGRAFPHHGTISDDAGHAAPTAPTQARG